MITITQKTALVTGASSGIGACFARQLAAKSYDLILVARREDRMQALAKLIHEKSPVNIEVLVADLSVPAEIEQVEQRIRDCQTLDLLVNNAGFGVPGKFSTADLNPYLDMITVHVIASVRLAHAALPLMISRKHGGIINVSSMAAFIPSQGNPTYAATKAYLNAFTESLSTELRGTGVTVQALCPGFTVTEFHDSPAYQHNKFRSRTPGFLWLQVEDVVTDSLRSLQKGRVYCIPGTIYKIAAVFTRLGLATWLANLYLTYFKKPG